MRRKAKVVQLKVLRYLFQGLSLNRLAHSCLLAALLGVIPFFGVSTALTLLASYSVRGNFPIMMAVHFVFSPIQLLLFYPFLTLGTLVFGNEDLLPSPSEIAIMLENDFMLLIKQLLVVMLQGTALWLLFSILIYIPLHYLIVFALKPVVKRIEMRRS